VKVSASTAAIDAARIISQQCLAIRARRLERTVTRLYDAALRLHGVSAAQLGVLVAIALTGEVQPKTLCTILDLEKSTLSRNIALMVGKGWIESKREGRAQMLHLTAAGSAVLASALPAWRRAQRRAQRLLPRDTLEMLRLVGGPAAAGPESDTGHAHRRT
jgi:DNA-binding MarR family transcriptional regulator